MSGPAGFWKGAGIPAGPRVNTFIECGCCGGYHRTDFAGDCRENSERFDEIPEGGEEVFEDEETPMYQVVVGNIGTIYDGNDRAEADRLFAIYVEQSKSLRGRAGGEPVTLFENNEIIKEHEGSNHAMLKDSDYLMSARINVTSHEVFTGEESALMAALIYKRFGWELPSAAAAWRRLLQNSCPDDEFARLAGFAVAKVRQGI